MIFILIFVENCLYYDAIHDFSVWLRTGSNPADISWFRSDTGKDLSATITDRYLKYLEKTLYIEDLLNQ